MEKAYYLTHLTDLNKDFSDYGRFYVGDSYCDKDFIREFENGEIIVFLKSQKKDATLVTPMVSELLFEDTVAIINEFIAEFSAEIVVNDYGILEHLKGIGYEKIVWGNMLAGQDKDPGLSFFENKDLHKRISADNRFYEKFFRESKVSRIELFNTCQGIEIAHLEDMKINLSYPYVVFSVTRYCPAKLSQSGSCIPLIPDICEGCKEVAKDVGVLGLERYDNKPADKHGIHNFYYGNRQMYKNPVIPENTEIDRLIHNFDFLPNGI